MPTNLSIAARRSINSPETSEVWVMLLTLHHSTLAAPIRVCNNNERVISRGETYLPFPFEIDIGGDSDDAPVQPKLRVANVDRQIVEAVRRATDLILVDIELVLASSPDTIEIPAMQYELRDVSYDAAVVQGTLRLDDLLNEPYPGDEIGPALFPGVFSPQG